MGISPFLAHLGVAVTAFFFSALLLHGKKYREYRDGLAVGHTSICWVVASLIALCKTHKLQNIAVYTWFRWFVVIGTLVALTLWLELLSRFSQVETGGSLESYVSLVFVLLAIESSLYLLVYAFQKEDVGETQCHLYQVVGADANI